MKDFKLMNTNGDRSFQQYLEDYNSCCGYLMATQDVLYRLSERIRSLEYEEKYIKDPKAYILYEFKAIERLLCNIRGYSHKFKIITSEIHISPYCEDEWDEQEYVDEWNRLYQERYDELDSWKPEWYDEIENKYFGVEKQRDIDLFNELQKLSEKRNKKKEKKNVAKKK